MTYILPTIFLLILLCFKDNYSKFCEGIKEAIKLIFELAPYIITIMLAISLFKQSGLSALLSNLLSPLFNLLGLPLELSEFILLRPFSGSGTLALVGDLMAHYGADSYVSKLACVIMGSGETIFYVCALYLKGIKNKKISSAILIALLISFISILLSSIVTKLFLITS